MSETKRCPNCKRVLDKGNFYNNKSTKDGLDFHCKPCRNKINKRSKKRRRDKSRLNIKSSDGDNPDKVSQSRNNFRRNKLNEILRSREYYRKNKERIKRREWEKNNIPYWKICEYCGKMFKGVRVEKYCSFDCMFNKVNNELSREQQSFSENGL